MHCGEMELHDLLPIREIGALIVATSLQLLAIIIPDDIYEVHLPQGISMFFIQEITSFMTHLKHMAMIALYL
jgi:hypothetical protein